MTHLKMPDISSFHTEVGPCGNKRARLPINTVLTCCVLKIIWKIKGSVTSQPITDHSGSQLLTVPAWFSPICCLQAARFCRHGWHLSERRTDFWPSFLTMSVASLQNISVASLNRRISRVSSSLMVQSDVFQSSGSLLSLKSDYSPSRKSHM